MSFLDTLRKSLTPELFTQVTDQLGDDFDFDLVPRSRLNKVIKQRNALRDQIAEGSQTQGAGSKGRNEDDDDDDLTLQGKGQQVDVKQLEQQWQARQDQAVQDVKIQYAALDKLRAANAIDAELIWNAGIIDKSKLVLDAAGVVTGLDEIITQLQKDKAHLFGKQQDVPPGTGKDGGDPFVGVTTKEEFLKLSYDKQLEFKRANPEVFRGFLN